MSDREGTEAHDLNVLFLGEEPFIFLVLNNPDSALFHGKKPFIEHSHSIHKYMNYIDLTSNIISVFVWKAAYFLQSCSLCNVPSLCL